MSRRPTYQSAMPHAGQLRRRTGWADVLGSIPNWRLKLAVVAVASPVAVTVGTFAIIAFSGA